MATTGKIFQDSSNIYQDEAKVLFNYYQQAAERIVREEERIEKEIANLNEQKAQIEEKASTCWKWFLTIILFFMYWVRKNKYNKEIAALDDRIGEYQKQHKEIFRGYDETQKPRITTFKNDEHTEQMIFDTGDYYSMCEHHILPFFGKYYFAYIPNKNGKILGISKIARVVGYCAARLQLQERLAENILDMLEAALGNCQGMAIVMRGQHMCKSMRGAKNQGQMTVALLRGLFKENADLRMEFYKLIDMQER